MKAHLILGIAFATCGLAVTPAAHGGRLPMELGGKLLLTRGISGFEGAGGGAITPWALITGNATDRGVGGTAQYTLARTEKFELRSAGVAAGLWDRVELSYAQVAFDTRDVGAALDLGAGFTLHQDVFGAKVRLLGNAVLDQDTWVPQVAIGAFYKDNDRDDLVRALGADDDDGIDLYVSATKLLLRHSLLANATIRYTEANQAGILGFGPDEALQPELSLGLLLSRKWVVGGEYRFKPDALDFATEDDWFDVFVAYAPNPHLTLTAAYAHVGDVVTFEDQEGVYLNVQLGF